MVTVQKLKLLALNCAITATSPTSPNLSSSKKSTPNPSIPCFSFRCAVPLKGFLGRRFLLRDRNPTVHRSSELSLKEGLLTSHKLRDLFICSPPHLVAAVSEQSSINKFEVGNGFGSLTGPAEEFPVRRRGFRSFGLRYRLLRSAWRPRLGAIPE
ncbi:uncharacterized protein A4U43_C01F31700 [Asparagus officinalis]|uniref:Uncharacterized protein n=1 Tax=Asparagus officinalis TaxID=4686 RepID=A0A5P1FUA1_ASPOF|nr:uncharacterized protein A4U43_C01F31700 [Asparagus officinalis]